jgi:hypothetical protein
MARITEKSKRVQRVKAGAPDIPPNTCPYIDFVLNFVENEKFGTSKIDEQRKTLIIDTLEYIREANDSLRKSSKFWYDEYKKIA